MGPVFNGIAPDRLLSFLGRNTLPFFFLVSSLLPILPSLLTVRHVCLRGDSLRRRHEPRFPQRSASYLFSFLCRLAIGSGAVFDPPFFLARPPGARLSPRAVFLIPMKYSLAVSSCAPSGPALGLEVFILRF